MKTSSNYFNKSTVLISKDFDGELLPDTVVFEGTMEQWRSIKELGIFAEIPCINCKDGRIIQKL